MYRIALLLLVTLSLPLAAFAVLPTPFNLCENVSLPSEDDFWAKWEAADYVVSGLSFETIPYWVTTSDGPPEPAEVTINFMVIGVFKGPESLSNTLKQISTSWGFYEFDCNPPELDQCEYMPESCTLEIESFEPGDHTVLFLKEQDSVIWSYMSFGSGIYDYQWLVERVGAPVSTEVTTWGGVKAQYR